MIVKLRTGFSTVKSFSVLLTEIVYENKNEIQQVREETVEAGGKEISDSIYL